MNPIDGVWDKKNSLKRLLFGQKEQRDISFLGIKCKNIGIMYINKQNNDTAFIWLSVN